MTSPLTEKSKLERAVLETAMRDHRRLVKLGWVAADLGGAPRRHWNACAALAKFHLRKKK